jgi:hypothetical protein
MVFNTTFNNISAISWQSVLLEETGIPGENHPFQMLQKGEEDYRSEDNNI